MEAFDIPIKIIFWLFLQVQDWTNVTPTTGKVQTKTKACMLPLKKWSFHDINEIILLLADQ